MSTLQIGPGVEITVQTSTIEDDGTFGPDGPVIQGPASWSAFKGCQFYDDLVARLPELQAQFDAQASPAPPPPNREQRRAQARKKAPAKKAAPKKPPTVA